MNSSGYRQQKLERLGFPDYKAYLASDLWQAIRMRVLVRDKYTCQKCGSPAEQVHHRSYGMGTLAGVHDRGLISLCRDCHHKLEYDGERKRTRREVREMDLGPRIAKVSQRSKKRQLKAESNRVVDDPLPITEKQRLRIVGMLLELGISPETVRLDSMNRGEWNELHKHLCQRVSAHKTAKQDSVRASLCEMMTSPPVKAVQRTMAFS